MARKLLRGQAGADRLDATARLGPGIGAELVGDAGADSLTGGSASDQLRGNRGNDLLTGGAGQEDWLFGGTGNDTLVAGMGGGALWGGDGDDSLVVRLRDADGLRNIRAFGGAGQDTLTLRLSAAQASDAAILAEIARLRGFIDSHPADDAFFTSRALGLRAQQVEALVVQVDHAPAPLPAVNLASLGSLGFVVHAPAGLYFESSITAAGDVNGDGLADLLISAPNSSLTADGKGYGYVVFGRTATTEVSLAEVGNGIGGFKIVGAPGDLGVRQLHAAGDVNGDGLADILVSGNNASYVVFGSQDWLV